MKYRLLIRHRDVTRKFLSFEFRDNSDGSFYVIYDGDEAPQRRIAHIGAGTDAEHPLITTETGRFRISYHASGVVNYHGVQAATIFCDPLYEVSGDFGIACISVSDMAQLASTDVIRATDTIAPLDDGFSGRITFRIGICPHGDDPIPVAFARVAYLNWFGLAISLTSLPVVLPSELPNALTTVTPHRGRHSAPAVTREEALIAFHKKRTNSAPHMCSWESTQGIGRIVFNQAMRRPPTLTVQFFDSDLRAEVVHVSRVDVRFRVRGPNGYIKQEAPRIAGYELDAEI